MREHDAAESPALGLVGVEKSEEPFLFRRQRRAWIDQVPRPRTDKISVRVRAGRQSLRIKRNHLHAGSKVNRRDVEVMPRSQDGCHGGSDLIGLAMCDGLEEGLEIANGVEYGLTAGIFSEDPEDVQWFFDHIEAGVAYANRASGATTGAVVGVQPFGGWKASTVTNKSAGGDYYLQQFLREQSQTTYS